MDNTTAFVD